MAFILHVTHFYNGRQRCTLKSAISKTWNLYSFKSFVNKNTVETIMQSERLRLEASHLHRSRNLTWLCDPGPRAVLWLICSSQCVFELKCVCCSILVDFHFSFKLMPCVVAARRCFCPQTTLFSSLLFYTPEQEESLLNIVTKYRYCISILNIDTEYCYCGYAL